MKKSLFSLTLFTSIVSFTILSNCSKPDEELENGPLQDFVIDGWQIMSHSGIPGQTIFLEFYDNRTFEVWYYGGSLSHGRESGTYTIKNNTIIMTTTSTNLQTPTFKEKNYDVQWDSQNTGAMTWKSGSTEIVFKRQDSK